MDVKEMAILVLDPFTMTSKGLHKLLPKLQKVSPAWQHSPPSRAAGGHQSVTRGFQSGRLLPSPDSQTDLPSTQHNLLDT